MDSDVTSRSADGYTRQKLIDVAAGLFTRHGYAGTSLQMVADQLGISKGAIYHHFRTREDLLRALVSPVLDRLAVAVSAAEAARTPLLRADRMLIEYAALAAENRSLVTMLRGDPSVLEVIESEPRWQDLIDRQMSLFEGVLSGPGARVRAAIVMAGVAAAAGPGVIDLDAETLRQELLTAGGGRWDYALLGQALTACGVTAINHVPGLDDESRIPPSPPVLTASIPLEFVHTTATRWGFMSENQAPIELPKPVGAHQSTTFGATPSRTRFNGFVGPSDVDDHVRIYADLTFNSFYDIRRSDIISATQVDEVDPESPTSVLVDGSAQVIFIHADRVEGAADYLIGAIRRDYLDESVLFSDDGGDHPTTWACATDPPKCTGPIFCPPKYERAF